MPQKRIYGPQQPATGHTVSWQPGADRIFTCWNSATKSHTASHMKESADRLNRTIRPDAGNEPASGPIAPGSDRKSVLPLGLRLVAAYP